MADDVVTFMEGGLGGRLAEHRQSLEGGMKEESSECVHTTVQSVCQSVGV